MNEYLGHTGLWHLALQYPLVIYGFEFVVGRGAEPWVLRLNASYLTAGGLRIPSRRAEHADCRLRS